MAWVKRGLLLGAGVVLGVALALLAAGGVPVRPPDAATVVQEVRTAARLETLDVRVYKKVSFSPEPQPGGSVWADLAEWVKQGLWPKQGRAIVFAVVHYGVDLSTLDESRLRVRGDAVEVRLPEVRATVELLPGETEVIGSNLDSAQTAELFEVAKRGFEAEAARDAALRAQARLAAELAVERALRGLGFREVRFVTGAIGAPPS